MIRIALAVLIALPLLTGCESSQREGRRLARTVADNYGYDGWDAIDQIEFTFNAEVGNKTVRRVWRWYPQAHHAVANPVSTESVSFSTVSPTEDHAEVHQQFINDSYWLVFPFRMIQNHDVEFEATGPAPLPLGDGRAAERLVVTWPEAGGYSPGDVYELFVRQDGLIREWIYRRHGSDEPTRISTWEDHRRVGPIVLSLDHHGPADSNFRVWFSDVRVRMRGRAIHLSPLPIGPVH
ncbi:MAG: hypothetical protein R3336_07415 [Phycisphaeraceae bacterium]|nr:hypothetical protein [Phycisphaeraceae bacterium]